MSDEMRVVVIGLGGIGSHLCDPLFRFLNYQNDIKIRATLIDGDMYEEKNLTRQLFSGVNEYKARQKYYELKNIFTNIVFDPVTEYVNEKNIGDYILDGDYVFSCLDNHKTRFIIDDYVKTLNNIVVISGGNNYIDGNVQIYIRRDGKDVLPSITDYHPEIINYTDKSPDEMSCEELQVSEPQLIFTNLMASSLMLCSFYNVFTNKTTNNISEIYFDIELLAASPKVRNLKN